MSIWKLTKLSRRRCSLRSLSNASVSVKNCNTSSASRLPSSDMTKSLAITTRLNAAGVPSCCCGTYNTPIQSELEKQTNSGTEREEHPCSGAVKAYSIPERSGKLSLLGQRNTATGSAMLAASVLSFAEVTCWRNGFHACTSRNLPRPQDVQVRITGAQLETLETIQFRENLVRKNREDGSTVQRPADSSIPLHGKPFQMPLRQFSPMTHRNQVVLWERRCLA